MTYVSTSIYIDLHRRNEMAQMGRPRNFDREQAVEQAMHLFWQHGYDATSLAQLKAGLGGGISAPSLCAAFGSKEAQHALIEQPLFGVDRCIKTRRADTSTQAGQTALRQSARMQ